MEAEQTLENPQQENPKRLFQALGIVKGNVSIMGRRDLQIQIGQRKFQILREKENRSYVYARLFRNVQSNDGGTYLLLCYPKPTCRMTNIAFIPINFRRENTTQFNIELEPFEFRLSGLWEKRPEQGDVITILRNSTPALSDKLEKITEEKRRKLTQPKYIPVNWSDPALPPSQEEKDEEPRFVEVKARFNETTMQFDAIEMLAEPTNQAPAYQTYSPSPTPEKEQETPVRKEEIPVRKEETPVRNGKRRKVVEIEVSKKKIPGKSAPSLKVVG